MSMLGKHKVPLLTRNTLWAILLTFIPSLLALAAILLLFLIHGY